MREVICVEERSSEYNVLQKGYHYLIKLDTLYSFDGDWYVDVYNMENVRIGSYKLNHFMDM